MITLYDDAFGADGYAVRLLLGLLSIPHRRVRFDPVLAIDPLGPLSLVDDDGRVLSDAGAILRSLAAEHDPSALWSPQASASAREATSQGLGLGARLAVSIDAARRHDAFPQPVAPELDVGAARASARADLRRLDEHLWMAEQQDREWLCPGAHPTIADLGCFAPAVLCEEAGVSRLPYPAIRRWLDRVKRLPGFVATAGVFAARG